VISPRPLKTIKPNILDEVVKINFYSFVEICRCISVKKRFGENCPGNFHEYQALVSGK
jgi:hypothetical protein